LDVIFFTSFKIALKREHDVAMAKNNFFEPYKITLAKWVDKTLHQL
jgi:hypothetical protein